MTRFYYEHSEQQLMWSSRLDSKIICMPMMTISNFLMKLYSNLMLSCFKLVWFIWSKIKLVFKYRARNFSENKRFRTVTWQAQLKELSGLSVALNKLNILICVSRKGIVLESLIQIVDVILGWIFLNLVYV